MHLMFFTLALSDLTVSVFGTWIEFTWMAANIEMRKGSFMCNFYGLCTFCGGMSISFHPYNCLRIWYYSLTGKGSHPNYRPCISLVKLGDNVLGSVRISVCPAVCPSVCVLTLNNLSLSLPAFRCSSVISGRMQVIAQMQSNGF